MTEASLTARCRQLLSQLWESLPEADPIDLPRSIVDDVVASLNSSTKSYRYVLPTQILAKLADTSLDARSMQVSWGVAGAFDARTIAKKVVVPFDRANHNVLGGSGDPYVNNPLRGEAVTPAIRENKKDKAGWDALCRVLDAVESGKGGVDAAAVYLQILQTIRERLETVHVVYPVPNRSSLRSCLDAVDRFLAVRSGGVRFEAIVAAVFEMIGAEFGLFASVRRSQVNAPDIQAGAAADIECLNAEGRVVMAVEAKDRQVSIRDIEEKLPLIREREIREAFFLSTVRQQSSSNSEEVHELVAREFGSGQNLYILRMDRFLETALSLAGESGRRRFLTAVGMQLDEYGRLADRQAWADQLRGI